MPQLEKWASRKCKNGAIPDSLATGAIAAGGTLGILIPPSITMIVYGVATETSIGRLVYCRNFTGTAVDYIIHVLVTLYFGWKNGQKFLGAADVTWKQRLEVLPRVIPFLLIIVGVLWALYGGVATPSEAAGVGALMCLLLVAIIYKMWHPRHIWNIISGSMRESVMILMIIGASALFSYMLSSLYVTQTIAQTIAEAGMNKWLLLFTINIFLLVAGFFLPPVAIILMTAPILLPIIVNAGFDPYWFAVVLTINMEIGLITPPVGLNLYVINGIVPDVSLADILRGALPFVACMVIAIIILCIFPSIATWLPTQLMGKAI